MTVRIGFSARLSIIVAYVALFLTACGEQPPTVTVVPRAIEEDSILIQNVSVFDSESLQLQSNMDVLITGDRITSLAPTGGAVPGNALVISGEGATLVPGLVDMHGHLTTTTGPTWEFSLPDPEANLLGYAYAGVTTIFDPNDTSDEAYSRRERVQRGELIGPRIFTTGRMLTHDEGHPRSLVRQLAPWWIRWYLTPKIATAVNSEQDAIDEVNKRADAGADAIKLVVDSIPLDAPELEAGLVAAISAQAGKRGLRTVAHIGTTEDAITAAENGVSLWVHGVYKERIPDDKIAQLVSYGIPMVPTSEVFDRYGRAGQGPIEVTPLERDIVYQPVLESFYPLPDDFDLGPLESWQVLMQNTRQARLDNVRRLHAAGMTILAGSDMQSGVFPGASLHREMVTLVNAGMTPAEVIHSATLASARWLTSDADPDFGLIAAGKHADLLLVEGDPTEDIHALANIREVILRGALLDRQPVVNGY